MIFLDTSAIYASLVSEDPAHQASRAVFDLLGQERARLISSSLVLQESVALLQSRVGLDAVRHFQTGLVPLLKVIWVDSTIYQTSMAALLASGSRTISLTDWSSFKIMQAMGIERAFTFDKHFHQQGFRILPGTPF